MDLAENAAQTAAEPVLAPPSGLALQRLGRGAPGELVLSFPLVRSERPSVTLTPAERGVTHDLLLGLTNQQIADRRRVAVRTIANQIGSVFRKLGVHSRLELALLLPRDAVQPDSGQGGHRVESSMPASALSDALDKLFEI